MGNAVANADIFQPIKNAEGSQKLSVETLFQRLKPAITLLLDKGVKALIITLGSDGAFLCFRGTGSINKLGFTGNQPSPFSKQLYEAVTSKCPRDHIFNTSKRESSSNMFAVHFPTLSTSVARLTGAGDCLVGGTLVAWCAGLDVTQSLAVGIAAAKAAVEVDSNVPAEYSLAKLAGKPLLSSHFSLTDYIKIHKNLYTFFNKTIDIQIINLQMMRGLYILVPEQSFARQCCRLPAAY